MKFAAVDELYPLKVRHACEWHRDPRLAHWYVRWVAGRTLLDEVLWLLAEGNARSQMPTELLGDSMLAIVRDWATFPRRTAAMLVVRVEIRNAEIVEQHRQMIERPAATSEPQRPASRPTRKGKRKPRPKAGRR